MALHSRCLARTAGHLSADVDENALRSCGNARTWNDESVADLLARHFPGEAVHGDDARLCRRPSDAIGNGGKDLVTGTAFLVERDKGFTDIELSARSG